MSLLAPGDQTAWQLSALQPQLLFVMNSTPHTMDWSTRVNIIKVQIYVFVITLLIVPEDQDGGINVVKTWMQYLLQTLLPAKYLARKATAV